MRVVRARHPSHADRVRCGRTASATPCRPAARTDDTRLLRGRAADFPARAPAASRPRRRRSPPPAAPGTRAGLTESIATSCGAGPWSRVWLAACPCASTRSLCGYSQRLCCRRRAAALLRRRR
jgi:hypothetical protein